MKKICSFIIFICLMLPVTAFAVDSAPLVFTADSSGKYIYCNNHEFIRRSDLADFSNENAKFIMNNEHLTADKYAMFISHVNHTEKRNSDNSITEAGFDIEVDALFKAEQDTKIRITALGFEVPENKQYWYRGKSYTYEDAWGCFNAWATYLQLPIRQIDSGQIYEPLDFEPIEFEIKAGEERWISEFIENYSVDPWFRPVHIMANFEILSGECDVNVAALKSNGTVGDRSMFNHNAAFGSYDRDRQYKGVADSLNSVSTELSYTIDDELWSGTALPVTVYNQSMPDGNETTKWYTHLNPRADQWSNKICTESDMLQFKYYDPLKKSYYGDKSEADDYWYFDTTHNDTSVYSKAYGSSSNYVPNRLLTDSDDETYACNLGNYGVILNYNISITNDGNLIRYANYHLSTGSNNVVILRDENGDLVDPYALCKGARDARVMDNMACVELPAHSTTKFTVQVILTTNYSGGMENSLYITDTPDIVEVYESEKQEISKEYNYTGKEFYKWENADLYISDDLTEWRKISLDSKIKSAVSGNWNEFEVIYTGGGYVIKPCIYDGIPYYTVQDFFKTIYFLDEDFNYKSSHKFDYYPSDFSAAKGKFYVKSASPYISDDGENWEYVSSPLPHYNYGRLAAMTKADGIYLSEDGESFNKAVYDGFAPNYIDSIGDVYYYAENNLLYVSYDGVYWSKLTAQNKIKSIYKLGDEIIVNNSEALTLPNDNNNIIIKVNDEYIGFDEPPIVENGVTLVPVRFISEYLNADVSWNNGIITVTSGDNEIILEANSDMAILNGDECKMQSAVQIINSRAYVPMRFLAEQFGLSVTWDSELNIASLE
jgi:hypothetical protein